MSSEPLLLSLDQGTSSSRAAIFNTQGDLIASYSSPLAIEYPNDGWVQQDPKGIWESQKSAMSGLEKKLSREQAQAIVSCGITNQRETTILWRRSDGEPCGPALVWQDGRTAQICEEWKKDGLEKEWRHRTGLILDPYFSASKINWLLRNVSEAQQAHSQKDLCFGTVESWLLWNLTAGKKHCSDVSNASRTLLMDLKGMQWIDNFCEIIGLSTESLPELVPCRGNFGSIDSSLPFSGVPIKALIGDQQAATFGQLCLQKGEAKCTYGTGAFLVVNTGSEIHRSNDGLLSTVGWTDGNGEPTYCLEGSLFNAGTVVQWLRDGLGIIKEAQDINVLANQVNNSGGVMFVPAFTGWGTPHWDPSARGTIVGLTRDTNRSHIARAALEGIALSVASLTNLAEASLGYRLAELAVDGGAAASDILLQAQADAIGIKVRRPKYIETTAKGAALMAGIESELISEPEKLFKQQAKGTTFTPQTNKSERSELLNRWEGAVERSLHWYKQ